MKATILALPLLAAAAPHHPSKSFPGPFEHDPSIDLSGPVPHDHHHIATLKKQNGGAPYHPNPHANRIPTSRESAIMARRILALTPLGTLSTVFPSSKSSSSSDELESTAPHRQPSGLGGVPIGMMDYISDCESTFTTPEGNPTILAISIATPFRNVAAGSNISLSLSWTPPHPPAKRIKSAGILGGIGRAIKDLFGLGDEGEHDDEDSQSHDPVPYSAANLPRFALLGTIEKIDFSSASLLKEGKEKALAECFVTAHPDAKYWLPGNRIHRSEWVRLVVNEVYWVGGFGDRAYIGWIPVEEWRGVAKEEWEAVRLPGEKPGWKEWEEEL